MPTTTPTAFVHTTLATTIDAMTETLDELRQLAGSLTTEPEIVTWREVAAQADQILVACSRMTQLADGTLNPAMLWLRAHARESQREIDVLERLFTTPPTRARSLRA
jgi:hypothetical protein